MPWLYKTGQEDATFGWTSKFFYAPPVSSASVANDAKYIELSLPTNVIGVDQQTSFATYNGSGVSRTYMCGGWTDNLVMTENFAFLQQGIEAPTGELVSGAGAGDQIGVTTAAGPGICTKLLCDTLGGLAFCGRFSSGPVRQEADWRNQHHGEHSRAVTWGSGRHEFRQVSQVSIQRHLPRPTGHGWRRQTP